AEIIAALAEVVENRPSRGFWKCCKVLRRARPDWNHKRIYRVYKAMKLNLRRKAKQRLPKRERVPLYVPLLPDAVWSADFMADALACGRRFRTFNVVDDFNREALHIEVDTSISSTRLVRIFEQLKRDHGLPQVLRTDNGPEFLGEAFVQWAKLNGMAIRYIQPGKPNQNAYIERFNRPSARRSWTSTCSPASTTCARPRTGGCSSTTRSVPTIRSAICPRPSTANASPEVLLLKCLLDGEAYGPCVRTRWCPAGW